MILSKSARDREYRESNPEAHALNGIADALRQLQSILEAHRQPSITFPEWPAMPNIPPAQVIIERPKVWEINIERDRAGNLHGTLKAIE